MSGEGIDESRKVTYEIVLRVSDERDVYDAERVQAAIAQALREADGHAWTGRLFWGGWEVRSVREVPVDIEWQQMRERDMSGPVARPATWEALGGALRIEQHPDSTRPKFLATIALDKETRAGLGVFPSLEIAQRETETAFKNRRGS